MSEQKPTVVRESTLEEIRNYLVDLGGGNQQDNMRSLSSLPNYYLLLLSEQEFFGLVFLQSDEVISIAPRGKDRQLEAVAHRALELYQAGKSELSRNWNLQSNLERLRELHPERTGFELCPLVLRDARGSEREHGGARWYIQDGCHRALAYAMTVLEKHAIYQPQQAFCATANRLDG